MSASSTRVFRVVVLLTSGFTAGVGAYHLLGEAVDIRMGSMKERYEAQLDAAERQNKALTSQVSSLQDQVKRCAVSGGSSSLPAGTEPTPQGTPRPLPTPMLIEREEPIQTLSRDGFKFDLMGCERSGDEVACKLFVTSIQEDRILLVAVDQTGGIRVTGVGYTELVDSLGSKHTAKIVTVGNQVNEKNGQIELKLVGDLRTPMIFTFSGVARGASRAALLEIACAVSNKENRRRKMFQPEFRNVEIRGS